MKMKLKFLLPNIKAANEACEKMLLARIDNNHIHFVAKEGTNLGKLQAATAIEKTNTIYEGCRGILIGAFLGLLGGLYVYIVPAWITYSPLWFTNAPWYVVLGTTSLVGAVSVALGAAMLGVNLFSSDLQSFKGKIEKGAILMIVAVPIERAKEIRGIMNTPAV